MTQPGLVKLLGATLVAFLTVPAAGALTPTPLPQEVVPRLTYELTVEPENPIVGDTVSLTFAVGIGGIGGLPQFMLWVDGEALSGDVEPVTHEGGLPDSVTFTLDAVGAGVAEVRLAVNYEAGVTVGGQCCIFQFVNDVSPVFQVPVIALGGAASPTPTATVAPSGVPGEHRIDVRVGLGEGTCLSGYPGRTVELFPTGRSASSDAQGRLAFDAVADGAYELRVVPPCSSGSCFPYTPVNVAGADLEVELCAPLCTPQLFLEPQAGSPGTAVALEGACQYIHSGGSSPLRFGPIALGEVHGNTAGDFTSGFTVPWVPPGVYAVSAADGVGLFEVTGEFPGCDGDCNGDLAVRIDELTRSVGIALRTGDRDALPGVSRRRQHRSVGARRARRAERLRRDRPRSADASGEPDADREPHRRGDADCRQPRRSTTRRASAAVRTVRPRNASRSALATTRAPWWRNGPAWSAMR